MALVCLSTPIEAPAQATFDLHTDVGNLPRLMPRGLVRVISASAPTRRGDVQVIEVGPRVLAMRWTAEIERLEPPLLLVDRQRQGPFRHFRHSHLVLPDGDQRSILVDIVDARLFAGALSSVLDRVLTIPALRLMFAYRRRRLRALLDQRRRAGPKQVLPGLAVRV